ncbi:MAG: glycosyltransferase family 2 protein [Candidatus Bathyarchaeia archaeon]
MPDLDCGVVLVARDEERFLERCLASLRSQTVKVFIVVVDDGSIDTTFKIASEHADIVVNLPRHVESWAGMPQLAKVFNAGFNVLEDKGLNYLMISGADADYPPSYVVEVIKRMRDGGFVLASGVAEGESSSSISPRGSGRVLEAKWFRSLGFKYPEKYGFEVYPVYKALSQGLKVGVFPDLKFKLSRSTKLSKKKLYLWGKGMKTLNYWWVYALGRILLAGFKNPLNGLAMFKGYLSGVPERYEDIKEFVPVLQKRMLIKRIWEIFS